MCESVRMCVCAYVCMCGQDLWDALSEASGKPVKDFMLKWTKSTGYPYIAVGKSEGSFHVTQSRFLSSGKQTEDVEATEPAWSISLNILSSNSETHTVHLYKKSENVVLPASFLSASWLKFNANEVGFFRVCYEDADMITQLQTAISSGQLQAVDKMGLLGDSFALSTSGIVPTGNALKFVSAFGNEKDYTVWRELLLSFSSLMSVWKEETDYTKLEAFIR